MAFSCAMCGTNTGEDEALCGTCLADTREREGYTSVLERARRRGAIARHYAVARDALRLARGYARSEAGAVSVEQVAACLAEVRRCRQAVRTLRQTTGPGLARTTRERFQGATIPGLHKVAAAQEAPASTTQNGRRG